MQENGQPLHLNFDKGGMKKLVEESFTNVAVNQAATYGMQVYTDEEDEGDRVLNSL